LNKLKENFDFDLKQDYIYYTIYANVLLLNKKLYLLYNFWNKRKEFLFLKKNNNISQFFKNYRNFVSLGLNNYKKKENFDYFYK
jgi:hypothetical protein